MYKHILKNKIKLNTLFKVGMYLITYLVILGREGKS
jgi:hypothetical protein